MNGFISQITTRNHQRLRTWAEITSCDSKYLRHMLQDSVVNMHWIGETVYRRTFLFLLKYKYPLEIYFRYTSLIWHPDLCNSVIKQYSVSKCKIGGFCTPGKRLTVLAPTLGAGRRSSGNVRCLLAAPGPWLLLQQVPTSPGPSTSIVRDPRQQPKKSAFQGGFAFNRQAELQTSIF